MIIIQKDHYHDNTKRGTWTMLLFEVAIELTLGVKLTISPKTPFAFDLGLGLMRVSFSVTRDHYVLHK